MVKRSFCKLAVLAFLWAIASTPATTLTVLEWANRPDSPMAWLHQLSYEHRAILVATLTIAPPLLGVILAVAALTVIRNSWVPVKGGGLARIALTVSAISTVLAVAIIFAAST